MRVGRKLTQPARLKFWISAIHVLSGKESLGSAADCAVTLRAPKGGCPKICLWLPYQQGHPCERIHLQSPSNHAFEPRDSGDTRQSPPRQAAWLLTRLTVPETKGRSLEDEMRAMRGQNGGVISTNGGLQIHPKWQLSWNWAKNVTVNCQTVS